MRNLPGIFYGRHILTLSSGNAALEALRAELDTVRRAAGVPRATVPSTKTTDDLKDLSPGSVTAGQTAAEVERLRGAVESAAAVLRAILPTPDEADGQVEASSSPVRPRARSAGAGRELEGQGTPLKPCLAPLTPRRKPRRKVSFGGEPEREPTACPMTDSDDDDRETTTLSPAPRKRLAKRDSLGYHKEKTCTSEQKMESDPKVAAKPEAAVTHTSTSSVKVHLVWFICCALVAALCGKLASTGAARPDPVHPMPLPTKFGDPSCWQGEWTPEFCCLGGVAGNPMCWDTQHTFARCCLGMKP